METIGIILAGGSGHRIGGNIPKQFLPLAGKTILEHTVSIFNSHPEITQIFIVTHAQYQEETKRLLQGNDFSKVTQILTGGKERYHSTLSALRACPANECNLIIHDAVRPLVSPQMISACIRALEETEACSTAIPATDTIFVSDQSGKYVSEIPDRNFLFNVQTPQAFRKSILTEAFRRAKDDPKFHPTDDCGVIRKYMPEINIRIIAGSPGNLKITYPEDLITAEKLLSVISR